MPWILWFESVARSRVEVADLDRLTAREDPGDQASSRSWPASGPRRPRSAVRRPEPAFAPRTRTTPDGRYWSQLNSPFALLRLGRAIAECGLRRGRADVG